MIIECKRFITSLKPGNPLYKLVNSLIVDTQYNYASRPRERNSNIHLSQTNTLYALHMTSFHYFASIYRLVANTINFSLAIYFLLLLYYSLPARPVIQSFILQEVLINISTHTQHVYFPFSSSSISQQVGCQIKQSVYTVNYQALKEQ